MKKIMIDPGHGGRLPGAVNKKYNVKEKDINLKVALGVRKALIKYHPRIGAVLTRTADIHVSLNNRCLAADKANVDAFISIHCNSRPRKGIYGLEIESFHYRGSKLGFRLAQITLLQILSRFRTRVPKSFPVINRGVRIGERWSTKRQKMRPFFVLANTKAPAALIELGFLCDDEEVLLLNNKTSQRYFALAIANAIAKYFEQLGKPTYDKDSAFKG